MTRKVFLVGVSGLLLFFTVIATTGRLSFYYHIVELYTETPESRISMPLLEVSRRQVADTWHAPRGIDRLHEGQDIFAPTGTPIYSATNGYVYNIGENNLGGNTVSVIGAGRRVYYYAHLNAYAPHLKVGDPVSPQTVLGFVGTTGNAQGTPAHLHFGIYTSSGAINPLPLLTDRATSNLSRAKPTVQKTKLTVANRKI